MSKDKKKPAVELDKDIKVIHSEAQSLIGQKIVASILDKQDFSIRDFQDFFTAANYHQDGGNYNQNGGNYDQDGGGNYTQSGNGNASIILPDGVFSDVIRRP